MHFDSDYEVVKVPESGSFGFSWSFDALLT